MDWRKRQILEEGKTNIVASLELNKLNKRQNEIPKKMQ